MSKLPLVSVVIPCLNRAHFLVPTIESVLQQDYPYIECIVIDGGSADGTLDILRRYDRRIKWVSTPDKGPPDAINKGWQMSSGEVLAWLNADDVWAPGAATKAVAYLQGHSKVDVIYGDCGIIDQDGKHIKTVCVRDWDIEYAIEYCDHIIYQAASFMRREILKSVGWLYPNLCHDHELWLRISLAGGNLQHTPVVLAYARDHVGNLGFRSDIVIPLKLDLTKKFFANPGLPPHLRRLRDRAISNTYLRGVDYVFLDRIRLHHYVHKSLGLIWKAILADPTNLFHVFKVLLQLVVKVAHVIIRRYLPNALYDRLWAVQHRLFGKVSNGNFREENKTEGPNI